MADKKLEPSIRGLILQEMERVAQPDPGQITQSLLDRLDDEAFSRFAEQGLRQRVIHELALLRNRARAASAAPSSARWDSVKDSQTSGDLDLARYAVYTGATRKWLLDCTASDLASAAEYHRTRANNDMAIAAGLSNLAGALKKTSGAEVVGDLPETKVVKLLNA